MSNLNRSNFQGHPFHLVSPSPWPILTCLSLLTLTTAGVLTMHGFSNAGIWLFLAFISLVSSMSFWFRDVISEGKAKSLYFITLKNLNTLLMSSLVKTSKAIKKEDIEIALTKYVSTYTDNRIYKDESMFFHYIAGLLEGDGHLSLPSIGVTTLNRVLNPRIIFTSHINNLGLYAYIQSKLGGIGRFQLTGNNTVRYIIGDIKSIIYVINGISSKLRTPKNNRLNEIIKFINNKYNLNLKLSTLNTDNLIDSAWLAGFTDSDGHFGIKMV